MERRRYTVKEVSVVQESFKLFCAKWMSGKPNPFYSLERGIVSLEYTTLQKETKKEEKMFGELSPSVKKQRIFN